MAKQKANDISAIAKEISKGYNTQIKELHKELNSIRKENIQNIKQVEKLRDIIDKNKQSYQIKNNQSSEQIKELKSQLHSLKNQNSRQQNAINGIKREYKKKFDTLKEQQQRDREERKAQAQADRERREAEKQEKEAQRKAEREAKEAKAEAQRQQREKEKQEKEVKKEAEKKQRQEEKEAQQAKKDEENRLKQLTKEFNEKRKAEIKEASKSSYDRFNEFRKNNKDIEIKNPNDIRDFNRFADSTSTELFGNKDKLLELSKALQPKDTSLWNKQRNDKLDKEMKESVNNFKDLNKALDKINNKLNLFAVALSGLRLWDWGVKHHNKTKSDIHSAYEAGLNYQQARHFNSVANVYGTDPQALTAEVEAFRMMRDQWGTGANLFRSEGEQRFLFGGTRGSLRGLSIGTLSALDPVKGYELIAKTIYNDMKNRPNDVGAIEAMAHKNGYGVIASIMKKALLSGVGFDVVWKNIGNATDSPFGREQTAFRFSLDLGEFFARLANVTDRLIMQFEELAGVMLKFINKIPFLSTSMERNQTMGEAVNALKNGDINAFGQSILHYNAQSSGFGTIDKWVRNLLGQNKDIGRFFSDTISNVRGKSHLDNDFVTSKLYLIDMVNKLIDMEDSPEKQKILKDFEFYANLKKDTLIGADDTDYRILQAIKKEDKKEAESIINSPNFMDNQVPYNNSRSIANSGSIVQSYNNGQVNVQSNIILEDRTQGGVIATNAQTNSSTRVDTIGQ